MWTRYPPINRRSSFAAQFDMQTVVPPFVHARARDRIAPASFSIHTKQVALVTLVLHIGKTDWQPGGGYHIRDAASRRGCNWLSVISADGNRTMNSKNESLLDLSTSATIIDWISDGERCQTPETQRWSVMEALTKKFGRIAHSARSSSGIKCADWVSCYFLRSRLIEF